MKQLIAIWLTILRFFFNFLQIIRYKKDFTLNASSEKTEKILC